jgi:hypothetical protein
MSSDRRSDEAMRGAAAPEMRRGFRRFVIALTLGLCSIAATSLAPQARAAEDAAPVAVAAEADAELSVEEAAAVEREEEAAAFAGERDAQREVDELEVDAAALDEVLAARGPEPVAEDELWMVSARRAKVVDGRAVGLDYWRYAEGKWLKASLEDLVAADPAIPTCFHVHGNRVSLCEANAGGWHYYTTLTAAGCRERGPLRWVIFTWPSDRLDCGPRIDVQIKAVRAECYGYYLASVVDRFSPDAQLSMLGYSFGTRLIGSSLHYLGGGSLRGRKLGELHIENRHVRTIMLAAALDDNHFSPGHTMQMAPTQIDRLLLGLNPIDPALKWYALLYEITFRPRRGQQALGHSGVAGLKCSALNGRVEQRNMQCAVGKEHDRHGYHYLTPWFVERMRTYVYFEDVTAQ